MKPHHLLLPTIAVGFGWWVADSRGLLVILCLGGALIVDRHTLRRLGWPQRQAPQGDDNNSAPRPRLDRFRRAWPLLPWLIGGMNVALLLAIGYGPLHWREMGYIVLCSACGITLIQWLVERFSRHQRGWRRVAWGLVPVLSVAAVGALFAPLIGFIHPPRRVARTTPATLNLPYDNVEFQTSDGLSLRGWFIPAKDARGTVIYCHGVTSNRGQVLDLLPSLHALSLNVLVFEFRGHGESDGHTLGFASREVADMVAAHDYVRRRAPDLPIMLLGGSYGAAMIVSSIDRLPDVACAWVDASFARFSHLAEQHFRNLSPRMSHAIFRIYSVAVWLDAGFWLQDVSPIEHLNGVRVPMMFLHGQCDERIPFAESEALFAACTAPKDHLWVPKATHYDLLTVCYDEYLTRLRGFVETYMPLKPRSVQPK